MKRHFASVATGVVMVALASSASAFDIRRSLTEAEILSSLDATRSVMQLGFRAQLINNGAFTPADVVATWETAGGIEPVPFIVLIPEGCFVPIRNTFHVRDFRRCGVEMRFEPGGGVSVPLTIIDFAARVVARDDGATHFGINTSFTDTDLGPTILGALGGAVVEIVIGAESAISLPRSIESVGGAPPDDG